MPKGMRFDLQMWASGSSWLGMGGFADGPCRGLGSCFRGSEMGGGYDRRCLLPQAVTEG